MEGQIEVEQTENGFQVRCPIHGVIRPAPDKVWTSHISAGLMAAAHATLAFHGKGAR